MKKLLTIQLAIFLFLSGAVFSQDKYNMNKQAPATNISPKLKQGSVWGEFNVGSSNHGVMGNIDLCYRKKLLYFCVSYFKSHVCYHDTREHDYFLDISNSQDHKTVQSISLLSGIMLPGKLAPSLSVGVSWLKFDYENTVRIDKNIALDRVWQTIIGSDYKNEKLGSRTIHRLGIPIGIVLRFWPKNFAGLDAMLNANLNTHSVIYSAGVGIHFGRIIRRS